MHIFCHDCIEQIMDHNDHANAMIDQVLRPDQVEKPCPNCRAPFRRPDTFLRDAFMPENPSAAETEEDDGAVRVSYRNRANIIDDSDDELPDICVAGKGKGAAKAPRKCNFDPSTKMGVLLMNTRTQ